MDLEQPGIPLGLLLLMLIGAPVVIALLFGLLVFRRAIPLVFHCQRCGRDFRRAPHRPFPRVCPLCRAPDWNQS